MNFSKTDRGFGLCEFTDLYGKESSVQESSLATEAAVWVGISDAEPLIMASDAKKMGLPCDQDFGWVPYYIPQEVLLHTRMHLSREGVEQLIEVLTNWLETGTVRP